MRLAIVDIETPLGGSDENFISLARVKELGAGRKPVLISLKTHGFGGRNEAIDKKAVLALRNEMAKYDGWVTWYGLGFDLPYIDDRIIINGIPRLPRSFARGLDMIWHAKMFKSMFKGASLEHVSIGLGYKGPVREPLNKTIFHRAEKEAREHFAHGSMHFDMLERHNAGCIRLTEFCYEILKPRIQSISRWG